ncbi:MAG: hypothetical protein HQL52_04760 [Magnetococcales bacterium]|nr:hypothetical protein [Magnetococcales bacterium]
MGTMVFLLLLFGAFNAEAGWMDSAENAWQKTQVVTGEVLEATKEAGGEVLEATKEVGGEAWDASKEVGGEAWDASKEVGGEAWDASKEMGGQALDASKEALASASESSSEPESRGPSPEERFADIWEEVLQHLDDGLVVFDKIKEAPDSVFIGEDKKSLRKDFNEILDEMIAMLDDPGIRALRERIDSLRSQIEETKREIADYREKRVTAPRKHMVKTTKNGYDRRIQEAEEDIVGFEREIDATHLQLVEHFKAIGLELDLNQVTVLLSRVDSDNIIQMSVVFDILKKITAQLMALTESSEEEIKTAKRYYGMHVVLIEAVLHMQSKYIDKISSEYLPKIDEITDKTLSLSRATQKNIARESDARRKEIYRKNLQAQELTLKVARLYVDNLKSQREKVVVAKKKAMDDFKLADNTYETVNVSADLVDLLNSSQDAFTAVMTLQVPEIVPFESAEMQKKYQELSRMIQAK